MTGDQQKLMFLLILKESHNNVDQTCDFIGIDRKEYYEWVNDDPDFAESVECVKEATLDYVEGKLFASIEEGDGPNIRFYLETQGKGRGYTKRRELTGEGGGPVQQRHLHAHKLIGFPPEPSTLEEWEAMVQAVRIQNREEEPAQLTNVTPKPVRLLDLISVEDETVNQEGEELCQGM